MKDFSAPDYVQMITATCLHEAGEAGVMVKTGAVFAFPPPIIQ